MTQLCEAPLHAAFVRYGDAKAVPALRSLPFWLVLLLRLAVDGLLWGAGLHGSLSTQSVRWPLNGLALVALIHGSINPFSKVLNVYWAGVLSSKIGRASCRERV